MSFLARRLIALASAAVAASLLVMPACAPPEPGDSEELSGAPEGTAKDEGAVAGTLVVGSTLIATANVNLRKDATTSAAILHVVPSGAVVTVVGAQPKSGFYNIKHNGTVGWSFGQYYKAGSAPSGTSSSSGSGTTTTTTTTSTSTSSSSSTGSSSSGGTGGAGGGGLHADAIARAASAVGFSYWWGHGRFRTEGPTSSNAGTCSGSCPSCTHGGSYGGDCSGLVAKVWQIPSSNTDLTADSHPYSTASFVSDTSQWSTVSRSNLQTADALVYHTGSEGHVFLYSSGDGWGSMDAYECKGCSYGCVYNLRTATSAYHGIRRTGY
jgi:uncharacterized protein YgiM (DUF1202 family)